MALSLKAQQADDLAKQARQKLQEFNKGHCKNWNLWNEFERLYNESEKLWEEDRIEFNQKLKKLELKHKLSS